MKVARRMPQPRETAMGMRNWAWVDFSKSSGIRPAKVVREVSITARKFRRRGEVAPICRARVQELPFADAGFDSLVATFPDYFILDPVAQDEMARVLPPGGRLVVVEGGHILKEDLWSRFLNWAFRITVSPRTWKGNRRLYISPHFSIERREVLDERSAVGVVVAVKRGARSV